MPRQCPAAKVLSNKMLCIKTYKHNRLFCSKLLTNIEKSYSNVQALLHQCLLKPGDVNSFQKSLRQQLSQPADALDVCADAPLANILRIQLTVQTIQITSIGDPLSRFCSEPNPSAFLELSNIPILLGCHGCHITPTGKVNARRQRLWRCITLLKWVLCPGRNFWYIFVNDSEAPNQNGPSFSSATARPGKHAPLEGLSTHH